MCRDSKPILLLSLKEKHQSGLTLPELLIALLLAIIIIAAGVTFFLSLLSQRWQWEKRLNDQTQRHLAAYFIKHSLQHACYSGCAALNDGLPIISHAGTVRQAIGDRCLKVWPQAHLPQPLFSGAMSATDSDVVTWWQMDVDNAALLASAKSGEQQLMVETTTPFVAGESIMIADCLHGEQFLLTVVSTIHKQHQQLQLNTPLRYSYQRSATQIGSVANQALYIAASGRHDRQGRAIMTLYRQQSGQPRQPLIDGVDQMIVAKGRQYLNVSLRRKDHWQTIIVARREGRE